MIAYLIDRIICVTKGFHFLTLVDEGRVTLEDVFAGSFVRAWTAAWSESWTFAKHSELCAAVAAGVCAGSQEGRGLVSFYTCSAVDARPGPGCAVDVPDRDPADDVGDPRADVQAALHDHVSV